MTLFRKLMLRLGVPLTAGVALVGAAMPAASADTSYCYRLGDGTYFCAVVQDTASGWAEASTDYNPGTGFSKVVLDDRTSGFSFNWWVEQRYNGGPVSTVVGPQRIDSGYQNWVSVWDQGLNQIRACFQFTWSGAAIHCTSWY